MLGGSFLGKTTVINDIFDTAVCFELLSDESLGTKRLLINWVQVFFALFLWTEMCWNVLD